MALPSPARGTMGRYASSQVRLSAVHTATRNINLIFSGESKDPDGLGEASQLRYRLLMQTIVDTILETYSQTKMTGCSPETLSAQGVTLVERILNNDGGKRFRRTYADTYPPSFRAEVDRILRDPVAASQQDS